MAQTCRALIVEKHPRLAKLAKQIFSGGLTECVPTVIFADMLDVALEHQPDVIIVDLQDAGLDAIAAVESLMAERPTPILLITPEGADRQEAIKALAAGALDVLERPLKPGPDFFHKLQRQALLLSRVSVVSHVRGKRRRSDPPLQRPPFWVVAIASSLGGPKALAQVLRRLPPGFPAPLVICQHITPGFSDDLARWLAADTRHDVVEAENGQALKPGRIFVAPSGAHLLVQTGGILELDYAAAVGGFRPSCDVLLRSVANSFADKAVGVVLTGMGRDGARGLKELRARGGHTLAQDEATSVVFGMPGEAIALGGAEKVLPLDQISEQLIRWVS